MIPHPNAPKPAQPVLEHGGIAVDPLGELETTDATRWRILWCVARVKEILPSPALSRQ